MSSEVSRRKPIDVAIVQPTMQAEAWLLNCLIDIG